jgi:hypothetical protein
MILVRRIRNGPRGLLILLQWLAGSQGATCVPIKSMQLPCRIGSPWCGELHRCPSPQAQAMLSTTAVRGKVKYVDRCLGLARLPQLDEREIISFRKISLEERTWYEESRIMPNGRHHPGEDLPCHTKGFRRNDRCRVAQLLSMVKKTLSP